MNTRDQIASAKEYFIQSAKDGNLFVFNALYQALIVQFPLETITDAEHGANALHWAAMKGHIEIVKEIIKKSPELVNSLSRNGSVPIIDATINGHFEVIKYLLLHDADPSITNQFEKNVFTVIASKPNGDPVKEYFQEYREVLNIEFIKSVKNGDCHLMADWLKKGADIESIIRPTGDSTIKSTAFFEACATGNLEMAKLLLDRHADINIVGTKSGYTPLHAAVNFGHVEIVKLLLAQNAVMTKDDQGQTPLDLAKKRGFQDMVRLFEKNISVRPMPVVSPSSPSAVSVTSFNLLRPPPRMSDSEQTLGDRLKHLRDDISAAAAAPAPVVRASAAPVVRKPKIQVTLNEIHDIFSEFLKQTDLVKQSKAIDNFCDYQEAHYEALIVNESGNVMPDELKCAMRDLYLHHDQHLDLIDKQMQALQNVFHSDDIVNHSHAMTDNFIQARLSSLIRYTNGYISYLEKSEHQEVTQELLPPLCLTKVCLEKLSEFADMARDDKLQVVRSLSPGMNRW